MQINRVGIGLLVCTVMSSAWKPRLEKFVEPAHTTSAHWPSYMPRTATYLLCR